ncbi:unnamed protein product [Sphagnum jensenii]|uniref:Lipoyl-binding domain-containing protein n=1 Tax=Sphagnum jensenii TaxID=128206 RepID=A0ABP0VH41_9BRYO
MSSVNLSRLQLSRRDDLTGDVDRADVAAVVAALLQNPTSYKNTKLSVVNIEVGITNHAASALGDIVFVDLPAVGASFSAGDSFGSVESVKAASDVYCPVGGSVLSVNSVASVTIRSKTIIMSTGLRLQAAREVFRGETFHLRYLLLVSRSHQFEICAFLSSLRRKDSAMKEVTVVHSSDCFRASKVHSLPTELMLQRARIYSN